MTHLITRRNSWWITMCGRFCIAAAPGELSARYQVEIPDAFHPGYNISPGRLILTVIRDPFPRAAMIHWGQQGRSGMIINVRTERLQKNSSEHPSPGYTRCLIPASGYFEWKQERKKKVPFFFSPSPEQIISLAGVIKEEPTGCAVAILTMDAPDEIAPYHHRMPVILTRDTEGLYLSQAEIPRNPIPFLKWHEVSTRVNQICSDEPSLICPVRDTGHQITLD
jgi:putative SOS response-associated peptidase YedK